MYKLVRLSLHNWYLADVLDIPISSHTAVIGQTGAGKSSILDAIQTIISGNNKNVLELNAAAGVQKSRSVRDYALGCVSDVNEGKPRRQQCETTIAMTLRDTQTGHHITLGLLIRAEAGQNEKTRRFIIRGYDFEIESFVQNNAVIAHKDMVERIQNTPGATFETYPSSTKFVAAYLEAMRPSIPPDPKHFLRSFSNALQAKEMSDPTDFVRRFVLEPMRLDLEDVKDSINVWQDITDEVSNLELKMRDLQKIHGMYERAFETQCLRLTYQTSKESLALARMDTEIQAQIDLQADKQAHYDEVTSELSSIRTRIAQLTAQVDAQKDSSQDVTRSRKKLLSVQKSNLVEKIEAWEREAQQVAEHFSTFASYKYGSWAGDLGWAIDSAKDLQAIMKSSVWMQRMDEVIEKISDVRDIEKRVPEFRNRLDDNRRSIFTKRDELERLERLQSRGAGARMTAGVAEICSLLEAENIAHKTLPDLVDLKDEKWGFALEALLGANREAILVPDEDVERAFDVIYRHRNKSDAGRIIITSRLVYDQDIHPNSIANVVIAQDDRITAFINNIVGKYVCVDKEDDLDQHSFAITPTGRTNAGLVKRVYRDRLPLLGTSASTTAEASKRLLAVSEELDALQQETVEIEDVLQLINRSSMYDPHKLGKIMDDARETEAAIEQIDAQIDAMESSIAADPVVKIEETLANVRADETSMAKRVQRTEIDLAVLSERIQNLRTNRDTFIKENEGYRLALKLVEESNIFPIIRESIVSTREQLAQKLNDLDPAERAELLDAEIAKLPEYSDLIARANTAVFRFAETWTYTDAPLSSDIKDEDRFAWVRAEHDKIANSEVIGYRQKLEEAKNQMEAALKEGLLTKLGEHFTLMEMQLDTLNKRLSRYTFVGQTYSFRSSLSPRFEAVYELVEEMKSQDFDYSDIESHAGFHLISEILSEDDNIKQFDDYRNYFNFEMYISHQSPEDPARTVSVPFSEIMGKLSGGQRQAPYYVAIGASMVSAYYPQSEPGDYEGLGVVLFDEAFNKLDIPNTQRLIQMFDYLGLQVIVAAPEEKRSSLIESVDSIVSVGRQPGSSDVYIDSTSIGPKAKAVMQAENPELQKNVA